jgi:hypothetical protein
LARLTGGGVFLGRNSARRFNDGRYLNVEEQQSQGGETKRKGEVS